MEDQKSDWERNQKDPAGEYGDFWYPILHRMGLLDRPFAQGWVSALANPASLGSYIQYLDKVDFQPAWEADQTSDFFNDSDMVALIFRSLDAYLRIASLPRAYEQEVLQALRRHGDRPTVRARIAFEQEQFCSFGQLLMSEGLAQITVWLHRHGFFDSDRV